MAHLDTFYIYPYELLKSPWIFCFCNYIYEIAVHFRNFSYETRRKFCQVPELLSSLRERKCIGRRPLADLALVKQLNLPLANWTVITILILPSSPSSTRDWLSQTWQNCEMRLLPGRFLASIQNSSTSVYLCWHHFLMPGCLLSTLVLQTTPPSQGLRKDWHEGKVYSIHRRLRVIGRSCPFGCRRKTKYLYLYLFLMAGPFPSQITKVQQQTSYDVYKNSMNFTQWNLVEVSKVPFHQGKLSASPGKLLEGGAEPQLPASAQGRHENKGRLAQPTTNSISNRSGHAKHEREGWSMGNLNYAFWDNPIWKKLEKDRIPKPTLISRFKNSNFVAKPGQSRLLNAILPNIRKSEKKTAVMHSHTKFEPMTS